ncbi:hypothetical protein HZY83_02590 [Gemella sp. GH3]|uniref:hypothetical protein n=1 Tax=unclassified Gemella TaxID=2624949 RepID=UPI0015D02E08|nr:MULTISPECIES: hypothetical protein [unclassified Gemella]MBF0713569.1 hypothetical protein [Gemella sp. GH3.1]NYS50521.1 hypothetical protein [Gemella sp. GH3]
MNILVYFTILIIITIPYIYFKKRSLQTLVECNFLNILYTARFNKMNIDYLENDYPNFHSIISNMYNVTNKNITFEKLEQSSIKLSDNIIDDVNKELRHIIKYGTSMDRSILRWYLSLNCHMHVFRNPYKILCLKLVFKFLPKHKIAEVKREKCKKINKINFCLV